MSADPRDELAARVSATWTAAGQLIEAIVAAMGEDERARIEAAIAGSARVGVTVAWTGGAMPNVELRVGLVDPSGQPLRTLLAIDHPLVGGGGLDDY